jgi:hypothetical protein
MAPVTMSIDESPNPARRIIGALCMKYSEKRNNIATILERIIAQIEAAK